VTKDKLTEILEPMLKERLQYAVRLTPISVLEEEVTACSGDCLSQCLPSDLIGISPHEKKDRIVALRKLLAPASEHVTTKKPPHSNAP
jgi:hypothetical protein